MDENNNSSLTYENFDDVLLDVQRSIGMEHNEWFKTFKVREKYMKILLITFFSIWYVSIGAMLILKIEIHLILILPHFIWIFLCVPFILFKIHKLTEEINEEREEAIVNIWKTKTHDIKEIIKITGCQKIYVDYYLNKNKLITTTKSNYNVHSKT